MEKKLDPSQKTATSREEKLSLLSAILGPEAFAKLNSARTTGREATTNEVTELDPKRAEWHRNRLMERFRMNAGEAPAKGAGSAPETPTETETNTSDAEQQTPTGIDDRLGQVGVPSDLSGEHPAVIAHILTRLPRANRVGALKSLPGPVARAVVRRMR